MRFFRFVILFLANYSFGQIHDQLNVLSKNKISTIAYWSVGDKKTYSCTQVRSDFKRNQKKPFEEVKVVCDLVISVLDSTDSSYLMRMSYENLHQTSKRKKRDAYPRLLTDYHIDYVTDEFGIVDSITNLDELKQQLSKHLTESLDRSKIDSDSINSSILNTLENEVDNDLVQLIFQREIILFHSFYGMELKLNEAIDLELYYPPIGDLVMMGEGKLKLTSINLEKDNCRLIMTQKPYKDEIQLFLEELITKLFEVESLREDLSGMTFSSSSKVNGIMELSSGWIQKISNVTTFKLVEKNKESKIVFQTTIEEN